MITDEEAIDLTVVKLAAMHVTHIGEPWQSPFGINLLAELAVSWGPFQIEYGNEGVVLFGKNTALPEASFRILKRIAQERHEAAEILQIVCADILAGDSELTREVRELASELLQGQFEKLPRLKVRQTSTSTYKFLLRDHAILTTLANLEEDFGFSPTRSLHSKKNHLSGSKIVRDALEQIWANLQGNRAPLPTERTIIATWDKRREFQQAFIDAREELRNIFEKLDLK